MVHRELKMAYLEKSNEPRWHAEITDPRRGDIWSRSRLLALLLNLLKVLVHFRALFLIG